MGTNDQTSSETDLAPPYDIIVYQFGKVASTSLSKTLDALPNASAFQSHFLGESALVNKLRQLVKPNLHRFFVEHGEGQLLLNIKLMRLVNAHRLGMLPDRTLIVLTVTREPIDWFISQIIQQLEGYREDILILAGASGTESLNTGNLETAANELLIWIKDALRSCGGIANPEFKRKLNADYFPNLITSEPQVAEILINQIRTFIRPYFWFENLVTPAFGVGISDVPEGENLISEINLKWASYFIIRYEELTEAFAELVARLGLGKIALKRENISAEKPLAAEIGDAFSPWTVDDELRELTRSNYTQIFRYD